jgi:Thiolase, N-terminal domain
MRDAVIVGAVRLPLGKRAGSLSTLHPIDLLAQVLNGLVERTGVDPSPQIEDVVSGCVTQTGEQGLNVARQAVLAAGWSPEVPGTTVDRQCGSSQQAAHIAASGVVAGHHDLAVAAGVESMSRAPMFSNTEQGSGVSTSAGLLERYGDNLQSQGLAAELIAQRWSLGRQHANNLTKSLSAPMSGQLWRSRKVVLTTKLSLSAFGATIERWCQMRAFGLTRPLPLSRDSAWPSRRAASTPQATRPKSPTAPPP